MFINNNNYNSDGQIEKEIGDQDIRYNPSIFVNDEVQHLWLI